MNYLRTQAKACKEGGILKTVLRTIKKAGIVILKTAGTILFLFSLLVTCRHVRSLHDEADFKFYMKHFHHVGTGISDTVRTFPPSVYQGTGEEAIRKCGQPLQVEQSFDNKWNPNEPSYTWLCYDGFRFGMFGDKSGIICCIRVDKSGVLPLRNGIDIGSTRAEVELAFKDVTRASSPENTYLIAHEDEKLYNGIWVYMYYGGDDRLTEIHITNGA